MNRVSKRLRKLILICSCTSPRTNFTPPQHPIFNCYEEDIWTEIAKCLSGKSLVMLGGVNKWFNKLIMNEEMVWKYVCLRDLQFPQLPRLQPVIFSWIKIYASAFDGSHSYMFRQAEKHIGNGIGLTRKVLVVLLMYPKVQFVVYCSEKCSDEVKMETVDDVLESLEDAKNGDISLISETMAKVEEESLETRVKEEDEGPDGEKVAPVLDDSQFTKLDELLTQTQLYSQFLLEKMDDITANTSENQDTEPTKGKGKGSGAKRKATTQHNTISLK